MATGKDLKDIAKARLRAGKVLIDCGDFDGAHYILGYALECALKSAICKTLKLSEYPDNVKNDKLSTFFKTHVFDILLTLSGLENDFRINPANPPRLFQNWSDATSTWTSEVRYNPMGSITEAEARRMHEALSEQPHGLLTWISKKKRW